MNLFKRCTCPDACKHPWWYRFRLRGRQVRGSTKTSNKQLADRQMHREYNNILEGNTRTINRTMLGAAATAYLAHIAKEQRTANKATRVLTQFVAFVTDQRLANVSAFAIEKWKLDRAKAVDLSTVNRELNILRGFFSRAVQWKQLAISPMVNVKKYHTDDVRVRTLSAEEIRVVLMTMPPDVALLCRATLECLPRLSELLALRREHIGPSWIEVRRKGGKVQKLAVTAELRMALLAHAHVSGSVFGQGDAGEPPTQEATSTKIARLMTACGLAGVSHHTMRHTGVTLMLEAGVNPRAIQHLAGWTTLRMLERYGHVRDAETQRAVAATAEAVQQALTAQPVQQEKQA